MGLNDGLLAIYKFNNDVTDSSGNGNDATNFSTTSTTDKNSVADQARSFSGTGQYLTVPNGVLENTAAMSRSVWFKLDTQTRNYCIYGAFDGTNEGFMQIDTGSDKLRFFAYNTANGTAFTPFSNAVIPTGVWTHAVGTWDGTNAKLYINGVLQDDVDTLTGTLRTGTSTLQHIGRLSSAVTNQDFDGVIDEFRIYNRALSDYEVLELYAGYDTDADNPGTLEQDLDVLLHFTGDTTDSSGNGNNYTNNGATPTTDFNAVSNQAYLFDGSNDTMTSSVTYSGETKATLSVFAKATTWSQSGWLIGKISGINDRFGIGIISGTAYVLAENGAAGYGSVSLSGLSTSVGHCFQLVFDGAGATNADRLKFYIDGELKTLTFAGTTSTSIASTNTFSIGNWPGVGYFAGTVDEHRTYSRVLSDYELLQLRVGYDTEDTFVVTMNDALAYHSFDSDGTSDDTGNGNTLTDSGTSSTTGKLSNARDFNGAYSLSYGANHWTNSDLADFTVNSWIYCDALGGADRVFSFEAVIDFYKNTSNQMYCRVYDGAYTTATTTATLSAITWHMVTVTRDSSALKIYIDGVERASTASPNAPNLDSLSRGQYIGAYYTATGNLAGNLDEFGVWGRALLADELVTLYNAGTGYNPYAAPAPTGYANKVNGVASASIGKVNGVATANISKVNGS